MGWTGMSSPLASATVAGSDSLSFAGILAGFPSGAASEPDGPEPAVAGFELLALPKRTLRSAVSDILLSSVTNDSPHHAL